MKDFLQNHILTRRFGGHLFSFVGIIVILYICRDFAVFFLTAFLCWYLFQIIAKWSEKYIRKLITRSPKLLKKWLQIIAQEKTLITIFYILFALVLTFAIRDIGPALISDLIWLLQSLSQRLSIDMGIDDIRNTLSQWQSISYKVGDLINVISPDTDTRTILAQFFHIGSIFFQVIFGYILSYVWLMEYTKVQKYFAQMKKWPFAFFYNDLKIVFEKIVNSFGLVFQAQSQIALVNTILTVGALIIIGIIFGQITYNGSLVFPYILALWCITFLTSFIPILGVFIGGIPIVFSGVSAYPGWSIVITIIIMLFVIHTIEGYFLNPRLVGRSLNIPAPIVFIILFVSEHFMGVTGFFLGVPVYLLLTEFVTALARKITEIKS